ncbi:MAG TPA: hypothetical protein VG326_00675 [Tepidisphaeraceae bacterium]|jgi:hypothetical protein|nr:hypothetical protein [Tepidisphaeraceae bacterium]
MSFTVFYAWQSDREEKVNHYLIRDALQGAIDAVNADLHIEEAPAVDALEPVTDAAAPSAIEIDWGTKDEPGTPNVAQVIFRKISECGVFLADLTYVGDTISHDDRKKFLPNSNVLIELGLASASVGWQQILLVMNKHFGGAEHLPFDLKNYAFPVTYDLAPGADKKARDAQQKNLTKVLEQKLRIMQKRSVWTKKADENRRLNETAAQMRRRHAEDIRQEFEVALTTEEFRGFKHERGVCAVTIVPWQRADPPLQFDGDFGREFADNFRPMWTDHPLIDHDVHELVILNHRSEVDVKAVTVLNDLGVVLTADHWTPPMEGVGGGDDVVTFHMSRHEPEIMRTIRRYLEQLKLMGIGGPYLVGLSLLHAKGYRLVPGPFTPEEHCNPPCRATSVIVPFAEVPDNFVELDHKAYSLVFRDALNRFWRGFGWSQAGSFDEAKRYKYSY